MPIQIRRGDRRAKLRNAERHRVAELIEMQRGRGGSTHRLRSPGARLPRRQIHQIAVGALALGGCQPDVHHVERWDSGA